MKLIEASDSKLVDETRDRLLEHFDSVRIFVTRYDGNASNTCSYQTGGGNFYAQLGQIAEWLSMQEQYQRNHAIRNEAEDE